MLAEAVLLGDAPRFDPHTGAAVDGSREGKVMLSVGAQAGLQPPRFCQICGRRMVVQVRPTGWNAQCSRHGELDSTLLER